LAEKAAWDFAKETGLDVVVVNPGNVVGPVIAPRLNGSMVMFVRLLQGTNCWLINWILQIFLYNFAVGVSLNIGNVNWRSGIVTEVSLSHKRKVDCMVFNCVKRDLQCTKKNKGILGVKVLKWQINAATVAVT